MHRAPGGDRGLRVALLRRGHRARVACTQPTGQRVCRRPANFIGGERRHADKLVIFDEVQVQRSLNPRPGKGFHQARADLRPRRMFLVTPTEESHPLAEGVEVLGLSELAHLLRQQS